METIKVPESGVKIMQNHYKIIQYVKDHQNDKSLTGQKVIITRTEEVACSFIDPCYFHVPNLEMVRTLREFVDRLKISELLIVVDHCADKINSELFDHPRIRVIHIPYWLYHTYDFHYRYNHEYNTDLTLSDQFLLLTGKIYKSHRIKAISDLYKGGLMTEEQGLWSLRVPDVEEWHNEARRLAQHYDLPFDVLKSLERNLDYNLNFHIGNHGFHSTGMPYDTEIYRQSGVVVLTESSSAPREDWQSASSPWLTEKTYLCMINHRPFIAVSLAHINAKLRERGFCTFDDYYDACDGEFHDNSNVAQAVQQFRANLQQHRTEIQRRLVHNHQLATKMYNSVKQQLDDISVNYLDKVLSLSDYLDHVKYVNCYANPEGYQYNTYKN